MSLENRSKTSQINEALKNLHKKAFYAFLSFQVLEEQLENERRRSYQLIEVPQEGVTLYISPVIKPKG